jgi:hypothetical protein
MKDNFQPCWARPADDNVSHVDTHKSDPGILVIASQGFNRRISMQSAVHGSSSEGSISTR